MEKEKYLSLSQLGLYNPQRLDDQTIESLFVVRQKFFQFLMDKIKKENPNSIPQHYLIIAQRGMGKSMLLKRIEVDLRKNNSGYIPILFPEEQYNLNSLAEFWLNSLDAMADTLEFEKKKDEVKIIEENVREFNKIKNEEDLASEAFRFLKAMAKKVNRRPVLLIDNMNLVFDRLDKAEQHALRACLMQNDAPILIGASAVAIEDTFDYGAAFYDAFQIHYLNKLSFEESFEVLNNLAKLTNAQEVLANIHEEIARLKAIHQLTGGNPRTAVMLFKIIVKGFSKEINDDLEALLDEITPLYKERFEALSTQMQIIVDAIALHWDPMNLAQLRKETRLENNQLSPQLKRLIEWGWIEKLNAYKAKGNAYQISERFFNIWFLMRRSNRRKKKEIYCLSKFLETFYGDEVHGIAKNTLIKACKASNQRTDKLPTTEVENDKDFYQQLKNKGHLDTRDDFLLNDQAAAYLNPAVSDKKDSRPVYNSGVVDQNDLGKFEDAEKMYLAALKISDQDYEAWINLARLYQQNLQKFDRAEKAYLKAIELRPNNSDSWNGLGNVYHKQNFEQAEKAYLKSIELNPNAQVAKYNLVFLYRDKMNKVKEAEELFDFIPIQCDREDSYGLNKSLFQLYRKNEGIAKEYVEKALEKIEEKWSANTPDDWWRFGAVVVKLGYGAWFLKLLEEKECDVVLAPYYVAIKAITEKDSEGYLNSKTVEVREPAKKIMEMIKKY